ncbi:MAG: ABC transporter ATP-binding protein [Clostridiales bacterium]|nr:ABC transporter ATP-binding protein [Clostridiales bacterium]
MKNKKSKQHFWKTIWDYAEDCRKNLFIAMIFALTVGTCLAIKPILIKYIIDNGITNTALSDIDRLKTSAFYCLLYILTQILQMSLWGVGYRNMLVGIEGFLFKLRSLFFEHIQTLCMRFHDKNSSGELFNYIFGSPMSNLKNFLNQFSMQVPTQVISMVISVSAMLTYDWLLTVVMVVSLTLAMFLNFHSRKKIRRLSGDLLKCESEASKFTDDVLHGNSAVKMYAIEDEINTSFKERLSDLKTKGITLSFTQWLESTKPEFVQHAGIMLVYLVGAFSCIYRGLTIGELTAFVSSMTNIMNALNAIFTINLMRSNAEASLDRINSVMTEESQTPENAAYYNPKQKRESAIRINAPCIEFKDVVFGYDDRKVFDGLNCKFEYNKSYGIVGSSGSGKSTITKLLMRLYEINDGEILMHNCNIKRFSLHDLRKSIGIVPQDPFIFQMSIINNIRITAPDAPMQEIMRAMEIARVHEFVNDLKMGWNTIVGDGGFGLSGGQKQRIAIARAILGKPEILVFDEATSALDNVSERHIKNAIDELMESHTVIIIAHRLTTIENVDEILVFDKGEIVQRGNYDSLSHEDGLFKDMLMGTND